MKSCFIIMAIISLGGAIDCVSESLASRQLSQNSDGSKAQSDLLQRFLAFTPYNKKEAFQIQFGYCDNGGCPCGYEGGFTDTKRNCPAGEYCRMMFTRGTEYACRKSSGLVKDNQGVCRSVGGCDCGTRLGISYRCGFGQQCMPTATGNECWDINEEMRFLCQSGLDINNNFGSCTCTVAAKADLGSTCTLVMDGINSADNHMGRPFSCVNQVEFIERKNADKKDDRPAKWASALNAVIPQKEWESILKNPTESNDDYKKYSPKFDIIIKSNHEFDRFQQIMATSVDGKPNMRLSGYGAYDKHWETFIQKDQMTHKRVVV